MTFSAISNDRRANLHEKLRLMKLRNQGVDLEADLQNHISEKLQVIQQKTKEVVADILPRIDEAKSQIDDMTKNVEVKVIDASKLAVGAAEATSELQERIDAMKEDQKRFFGSLLEMKKELDAEKQEKVELLNLLGILRKKLEQTTALPCKSFLYQVGERTSYRIATGKAPNSYEGRGGSQRAWLEQLEKFKQ